MQLYCLQGCALSTFSTLSPGLRDPAGSVLGLPPCTVAGKPSQAGSWGTGSGLVCSSVCSDSCSALPVNPCLKKHYFICFHSFYPCLRHEVNLVPITSIVAGKRIFHSSFQHELYVIQLYNITFLLCLCFGHI